MPDYTNEMTITFGDASSAGGVPCREVSSLTVTYENEILKRILIPAATTDQSVDLSELSNPKILIISSIEGDFTVKIGNGTGGEEANLPPISIAETSGSLVLQNPNGLGLTTLFVTTSASPTSGARIRVFALE